MWCSQVLHDELPAERLVTLECPAHCINRLPRHTLVGRLHSIAQSHLHCCLDGLPQKMLMQHHKLCKCQLTA